MGTSGFPCVGGLAKHEECTRRGMHVRTHRTLATRSHAPLARSFTRAPSVALFTRAPQLFSLAACRRILSRVRCPRELSFATACCSLTHSDTFADAPNFSRLGWLAREYYFAQRRVKFRCSRGRWPRRRHSQHEHVAVGAAAQAIVDTVVGLGGSHFVACLASRRLSQPRVVDCTVQSSGRCACPACPRRTSSARGR